VMKPARIPVMHAVAGRQTNADRGCTMRRLHVPVDPGCPTATTAITEKTQDGIIEDTGPLEVRNTEIDMMDPSAH